jgi:hypothetical protein
MNQKLNSKSDTLSNSDVAWNASNLFYIFLNELDMDYRDAYYMNDWNKMYKVFKLKYMKVNSFILPKADTNEKDILSDDKKITGLLSQFKNTDTDHSNRFNSAIVQQILDIIENKMILIDQLMSKAGMNILLKQIEDYRPASFGGDDF